MNEGRVDRRKDAHDLLDLILDQYEDARYDNPGYEYYRVDSAQIATRNFWRLYELCCSWAEDVHRGHFLYQTDKTAASHMNAFAAEFATTRDDDDWVFEIVGSLLRSNSFKHEHFTSEHLNALDEYVCSDAIGDAAIEQHVLFEMTQSKTVSTIWPELLHTSTLWLQFGFTPWLFQQVAKRNGNSREMLEAKTQAVDLVLFRHGQGVSKEAARRDVGEAVGVSEHTLKKWEIEIRKNGLLDFRAACAELAGSAAWIFENVECVTEQHRLIAEGLGENHGLDAIYYGMTMFEGVRAAHREISEVPLGRIRAQIRKGRMPSPG